MTSVSELKKFKVEANIEFDELTQWMNTTGFKSSPRSIKKYATAHCCVLLDEIERYKTEISRREYRG